MQRNTHPYLERGGRPARNYLSAMVLELESSKGANSESHIRNLEAGVLATLTIESATMARESLAGTDWIPGK